MTDLRSYRIGAEAYRDALLLALREDPYGYVVKRLERGADDRFINNVIFQEVLESVEVAHQLVSGLAKFVFAGPALVDEPHKSHVATGILVQLASEFDRAPVRSDDDHMTTGFRRLRAASNGINDESCQEACAARGCDCREKCSGD